MHLNSIIIKSIIIPVLLTSCNFAPKYHRPEMDIPPEYKEIGTWVTANPNAAEVNNLEWWEIYNDPVLNELEEQMPLANPDLKAAIARYDEARALASVALAGLFPTISALGIPSREHLSQNIANPPAVPQYNDFLFALDLSYQIDVWGEYRNAFYAGKSMAKASAADLASINLSLQADVATYYFTLRGADLVQRVLDENVLAYERALFINKKLFEGGGAPIATYYEAEAEYENAKTLAADIRLKRAQLEHAIAVLLGKVPAAFKLPPLDGYDQKLVAVAPYLPSTLLERRPDIAAAEFRVQAANDEIGIARAAYFPAFNLHATFGVESQKFANLFQHPSLIWSLGPSASGALATTDVPESGVGINQVLIDFGRLASLEDQAWADYWETVYNYQQTVLVAYQEVEDNLVAMHQLLQENATQTSATDYAYKVAQQSVYRHEGGLVTYLEVAGSLVNAYQMELSAINIRTRHQVASVQLIRALGGGWTVEDIGPLNLDFDLL